MDKTGLIACTNELISTTDKFACVSRPRRFGKTMALKMLAAYYSRGCDSADLFKGLKIEKAEGFQNDMRNFRTKDDVLTLLIHLGYLGYDSEAEEAFIPNKEIMGEFENAMSVGGWPEIMRVLRALEGYSGELLLVGINYDKENKDKPHSCVIEKLLKED